MSGRKKRYPAESVYGQDIAVMHYMHWSWDAYQEAPHDLIDEIIARIHGEAWAADHPKVSGGDSGRRR